MRLSDDRHPKEGALSATRVESRLAAILASDNAAGNFIKIVPRARARIALPAGASLTWFLRARPSISVSLEGCAEASAAVSQGRVVVGAPAEPTTPDAATAR